MLKESDLIKFTGTENHFIHQLTGLRYTDGVQYVAEKGKAYWLLDDILAFMKYDKKFKNPDYQDFTVWKLRVNPNKKAILSAEDGNYNQIFSHEIPWTDFPMDKIDLWFEQGVLILSSEH